MSPPREASPEMIHDVLESINRSFAGPAPIQFGEEELIEMLPSTVLGAVEELLELLPNSVDGTLYTKWGDDDEGIHPGLPTYDDIDEQARHESVDLTTAPYGSRYTVTRRDTLIEVRENHSNNGGNVLFWFTPFDPTDTGHPRSNGYVNQD